MRARGQMQAAVASQLLREAWIAVIGVGVRVLQWFVWWSREVVAFGVLNLGPRRTGDVVVRAARTRWGRRDPRWHFLPQAPAAFSSTPLGCIFFAAEVDRLEARSWGLLDLWAGYSL